MYKLVIEKCCGDRLFQEGTSLLEERGEGGACSAKTLPKLETDLLTPRAPNKLVNF